LPNHRHKPGDDCNQADDDVNAGENFDIHIHDSRIGPAAGAVCQFVVGEASDSESGVKSQFHFSPAACGGCSRARSTRRKQQD
jgi:hypothetical protein